MSHSANTVPQGQKPSLQDLQALSYNLSQRIITATTRAGSGHPSSSLSMIDALVCLYFGGIMRHDPQQPNRPERDRFILSKGHGAPALYVALAQAGYFDDALLDTMREMDSPTEGHPNMRALAGVEASTGSLGQGLSIALGHALAGRMDQHDYRVYALIGDGEAQEGQIWECALAAAKYGVDNLTLIIDVNEFQQTAPLDRVMPNLKPLAEKWRAFDWYAHEVNGHDLHELMTGFEMLKSVTGQPQVLITHTKKGKGLSPFAENEVNRRHGKTLSEDEAQVALQELAAMYAHVTNGHNQA